MRKTILAYMLPLVATGVIATGFFSATSANAYTGTLTFGGGCEVSNQGVCTLRVSNTVGLVEIYASRFLNGRYERITYPFRAPGIKRVANSTKNVCFYAKSLNLSTRTRTICLSRRSPAPVQE